MSDKFVPEFSRLIDVIRINGTHKVKANEQELLAISKRFRIPAISKLEAEVAFKRGKGGLFHVEGTLNAVLTQTCVVSLENFELEVNEAVDATYTEGGTLPMQETRTFEDEDPDAPEPIVNGKIDIGELVVQSLSLALDPHPRKPGVEFKGYDK